MKTATTSEAAESEALEAIAERLCATTEPGARDVARRLFANGASTELIDVVLDLLQEEDARGAFAIDAAAKVLGRSVRLMPPPRRTLATAAMFAFVGPAGVGKTTVLRKLAHGMIEKDRRPLCLSIDPRAADEPDPVALIRIEDAENLRQVLRRHGPTDAVLVDTPGLSPRRGRDLAGLGEELRALSPGGRASLLLVLPSTDARTELRKNFQRFAPLKPDGVVLTHLDRCSVPATAVEEVARARLPLAFLAAGEGPGEGLWRPTPDRVADLFLRGHIAGNRASSSRNRN